MSRSDFNSTISGKQSTTTPLAGAGVFTGIAELVDNYASISVMWYADVAGTSMSMQFSPDGTNWDRQLTVKAPVGGGVHILAVIAKYFRVVYTNGATPQGAFRLQTIYHEDRNMQLVTRLNSVITDDYDTQLVRIASPPILDINRNLTGRTAVRKFGANTAVSTQAGVWDAGGAFNFPTSFETVRIKAGGNANDTSAGTGARAIVVEYLDENFVLQSETLVTAGASVSSPTTGLVSRIIRAYVSSVGTYGVANTGNIVIENTTAVQVLAQINAGNGQTEHGAYTVPAGKTAYIVRYGINVSSGNTASVYMYKRDNADDVTVPFSPKRLQQAWYDVDKAFSVELQSMVILSEKTDIWFEAVKVTGGGNASVGVNFDIILIDN